MEQERIIARLEARAKAAGVTMRAICISAGIHPTTFCRWKKSDRNLNPTGATLSSLNKLEAAIRDIEAKASRTRRPPTASEVA